MKSITRFRFLDVEEGKVYFVAMPIHAEVVHIGMQDGFGAMWFSASSPEMIERRFMLVSTGSPYPDNFKHLGTWCNGPETWHVLEEKARPH